MRIEFDVKFMDLLRFNAGHQFRSIPLQLFNLGCAFFLGWVMLYSGEKVFPIYVGLIIGVICYLFLWLIQLIFNVFYLYSKKNRAVITRHIIELLDDELYEETEYSRSYYKWNGDIRIVKMAGYTTIYVSAHQGFPIPIKAFRSEEERNKFCSMVEEKVKNA